MEIRPFDHTEPQFREYVRQARTELLAYIGIEPTPQDVEPLPYATYLGAFDNGEIVGFTESHLFREKHVSYADAPLSRHYDFDALCDCSRLAHIRTAYVDPSRRRASSCFMDLYLYTARHFLDRGADFSTISTTQNPYLTTMYRKMGARELFTVPEYQGQAATLIVFAVDLRKLLEHPLAAKRGWQMRG